MFDFFDLSFWIGLLAGVILLLIVLAIVGTNAARRGRHALIERDAYNRQIGGERARRAIQEDSPSVVRGSS